MCVRTGFDRAVAWGCLAALAFVLLPSRLTAETVAECEARCKAEYDEKVRLINAEHDKHLAQYAIKKPKRMPGRRTGTQSRRRDPRNCISTGIRVGTRCWRRQTSICRKGVEAPGAQASAAQTAGSSAAARGGACSAASASTRGAAGQVRRSPLSGGEQSRASPGSRAWQGRRSERGPGDWGCRSGGSGVDSANRLIEWAGFQEYLSCCREMMLIETSVLGVPGAWVL